MYLTIRGVILFVATTCLLWGVWQFVWMKITYKGWQLEKEENETFFAFCCRYYGGIIWGIRKFLGISWFYNSKAFRLFVRLRGLILVLISIGLFIALIYIDNTDYSLWLDIKL